MDTELLSPTRVRAILAELEMRPSKTLGQNFLIDANILRILLDAAHLEPADRVLEVGPGLGTVTGCLLERARHVIAVEKDRRLCEYLMRRFAGHPRLTLVCGDALEAGLGHLPAPVPNKMVSNLPYSVASRVLVDLAGTDTGPERIVVTVQEEVARRLTAAPGSPDYGLLSVRVQVRYTGGIVKKVSATCFSPPPRVGSIIVALQRVRRPELCREVEDLFELAAKVAFEHRRKQVGGIFQRYWPSGTRSAEAVERLLAPAAIDPCARPEEIPVANWLRLAEELRKQNGN